MKYKLWLREMVYGPAGDAHLHDMTDMLSKENFRRIKGKEITFFEECMNPLVVVGGQDDLAILAHGSIDKVAHMTATQLAKLLKSKRLSAVRTLDLVACETAVRGTKWGGLRTQQPFALRLKGYLKDLGIVVGAVVGRAGIADFDRDGEFVAPYDGAPALPPDRAFIRY